MNETLQNEAELAETYSYLDEEQKEVVDVESYHRALADFDDHDHLAAADDDPDNPFNWEDVRIEVVHDIDAHQDYGFRMITGVDEEYGQTTHDIAFNFVCEWLSELKDELRDNYADTGELTV